MSPGTVVPDRCAEENSRILLQTVSPDPWYLHTESKQRYQFGFTEGVQELHSSIRALLAYGGSESAVARSPWPNPTLFVERLAALYPHGIR